MENYERQLYDERPGWDVCSSIEWRAHSAHVSERHKGGMKERSATAPATAAKNSLFKACRQPTRICLDFLTNEPCKRSRLSSVCFASLQWVMTRLCEKSRRKLFELWKSVHKHARELKPSSHSKVINSGLPSGENCEIIFYDRRKFACS